VSCTVVEPITEHIARQAAALFGDAGLHGLEYAIDAMLCATAFLAPGPVTVLTSDPKDRFLAIKELSSLVDLQERR